MDFSERLARYEPPPRLAGRLGVVFLCPTRLDLALVEQRLPQPASDGLPIGITREIEAQLALLCFLPFIIGPKASLARAMMKGKKQTTEQAIFSALQL